MVQRGPGQWSRCGPADRVARGKDAGRRPRWSRTPGSRPGRERDPVGLLLGQAASRVPELVPVRHGRMLVSPFTFYRGAALPNGRRTRRPRLRFAGAVCGDAHLSNFGAFASPERNLVFDVNDFDETLPGPFEWDVKRLAASLAVAAGTAAFPPRPGATPWRRPNATAPRCASSAAQTFLDVWYAHLDIEPGHRRIQVPGQGEKVQDREKLLAKAHTADSTKALGQADHHGRRAAPDHQHPPDERPGRGGLRQRAGRRAVRLIRTVLGKYRRTLQSDRRHLLEQFTLVQVARRRSGSAASAPAPGSC